MMAITHAVIAAETSLILGILGTAALFPLGLAVLGSQIPDLDTTISTIGQIFLPISFWIKEKYPHRSITHSFLATLLLLEGSSLLSYLLVFR